MIDPIIKVKDGLPVMPDPTYDQDKIRFNGVWGIAFILSEMVNDHAPPGWSQYIPIAESAIETARIMEEE